MATEHDDNHIPNLVGLSSSDGKTPVNVWADPSTHRLLTTSSGGSGTVTEVDTGTGLTGGPITTTGTIALDSKLAPLDTLGSPLQLIRVNAGATALEYFTSSGGGVTSVVGTSNRITVDSTDPANPIVNIAATYVGQSSITTLGTITTGTWQGTKVGLAFGGTNADLSATGGTSQVLKQVSSGAAITVGQLAASDLSNGTTGSGGGVVLATGPTMTNPVVGTQATSDNSTKAASTAYVTTGISNAIAGVNPAVAVQYATTTAGATSGLTYNNGVSGVGATLTGANNTVTTFDGHAFVIGDVGVTRVLVKNDTQSPSGAFNGVYLFTALHTAGTGDIFTRALDYDTPSDINNTGAIPVVSGTANTLTSWLLTSNVTTIGTDPLTYSQFSINPSTALTTTLTSANIFVGNGSNIATGVAVSGDLTLVNTGAFTVAKIAGTVVSGTTGTTNVVFSGSPTIVTPTITTSATVPLIIGGSGTTGTQLTLQTTSGNGTTDALVIKGGNNGGSTFATFTTGGALTLSTSGVLTTGTIELGAATDTTLSRSGAGVLAVEGVVIPSISSTNTLTNKRITRRITTVNAPGATPTTNSDNDDLAAFTGVGTAITSMTTNLSGTPVNGDLLEFRFTDDGTARAITWGTSFESTTVTLPTTTVISTMLRVGFEWNSTASKWDCIAVA